MPQLLITNRRFVKGRRELLQVTDLLSMTMISRRIKTDLSTLYGDLKPKISSLQSLRRTHEKYGDFLLPLIESCLLEEILIVWERNRDLKESSQTENRSLENFNDFLETGSKNEDVLARTGLLTQL